MPVEVTRLARSTDGLQAVIHVDGASKGNPGPAGAGVVILGPGGDVLREMSVPLAHATNNVAEYTGLIRGLEAATELGLRRVEVRTDSELMVRQLSGEYRVKNPGLQRLHAQAVRLIGRFEHCAVGHVGREHNAAADRLANAASREAARAGTRKPNQGHLDL
jgi:ribonuclease HI